MLNAFWRIPELIKLRKNIIVYYVDSKSGYPATLHARTLPQMSIAYPLVRMYKLWLH